MPLVYKRTHEGDPDERGRFGLSDCMGRIRRWPFNSVVGVGGNGAEAVRNGIAGRINWVGIGVIRTPAQVGWRGPIISFSFFLYLGSRGEDLDIVAPALAKRMYSVKARSVTHFTPRELRDIRFILSAARARIDLLIRAE
jgi:hypothetical protein